MKNKKNLLVTLADKNYIEQAKQLFSSVYWNAGWKGDYMLLAHEISEKKLKWFRDKGILVKKCKPLIKINRHRKSIILCKFYLFTLEFKKWKNIVYLDADMIVRASLDDLTKIKGFASVLDHLIVKRLIDQFITPPQMYWREFKKFKKKYNLNSKAFKAGLFVFNTHIISKNTFQRLVELYQTRKKLIKSWVFDQPVLNLFFYKKWKRLPMPYNFEITDFKFINYWKTKAIVLHSKKNNKFFEEEKRFNLKRANKIDLNKIQPPNKKFTHSEIKNYSSYLKIRSIFYFPNWIHFIDYQIGSIGIFLYNWLPKLYFKLRKIKLKFRGIR